MTSDVILVCLPKSQHPRMLLQRLRNMKVPVVPRVSTSVFVIGVRGANRFKVTVKRPVLLDQLIVNATIEGDHRFPVELGHLLSEASPPGPSHVEQKTVH